MFLLISITVFLQSISLHYIGDPAIKKFLFSGTNQFEKIEKCKDDCVSIKVDGKKITLILKSQGESVVKKYDFSKNQLSQAQFADLLRLKIILFKKEYRKKIERRFIYLLKTELESRIKGDLEEKIKKELEEKIKKELEEKLKLELEIKIKKELEIKIEEELKIKIKKIQTKLEEKIEQNLNNKQKSDIKLKDIESKLKKEISFSLEKELKLILNREIDLETKQMKKQIKKEIKEEMKNEYNKNIYNYLSFAGNINLGIKKERIAGGALLEYKRINNQNIMTYSLSFLMREKSKNSNVETNFILLQIAIGREFRITKKISLEFTGGAFAGVVNLIDENNWYFGWETTGGVLGSINGTIMISPKWGIFFKNNLSLFLINYRNTDNDGLYGNKKISTSFSLGGFFSF